MQFTSKRQLLQPQSQTTILQSQTHIIKLYSRFLVISDLNLSKIDEIPIQTRRKSNNIIVKMQHDKRQIRLEDFEIEYKLGEGAYGYVFLASKECHEYAIKEMNKHQLKKHHAQHLPIIEKQVLRMANHPGIVKSHFAFQTSSKLYLALQFCEGGSIEDLANRHLLTEQAKRFYTAEIVDTLHYLHQNGVVHRDLKPSNIMLDKKNHIKIIDFGTAGVQNSTLVSDNFKQKLATFKGKDNTKVNIVTEAQQKGRIRRRKSSFVGTSSFLCPELIQFNECEHPADLWALGCILYYMYYRQSPFTDSSEFQMYRQIKQAKLEFPENSELSPQAKDLIIRLLVKSPSQRLGSCSREQLSFAALKKHPYIAQYDCKNLFQLDPPKIFKQNNFQFQMEKLAFEKSIPLQLDPLSRMLIKHTETRGDIICKLFVKRESILQSVEIGDKSERKVFKLEADSNNKIAHQLSDKRFSVGVQGCQRLIFTNKDAKTFCQYFNNLSQRRLKSNTCSSTT